MFIMFEFLAMAKYIVNKVDKGYAEITVTGIPYHFDDRTGKLSIWNVTVLFEGVHDFLEKRESFMDFHQFKSDDISFVIVKHVWKINPEFFHYNFPNDVRFDFIKKLFAFGRTSYTIYTKVTQSGKVLAENFMKVVRIDNKSRRPVVNPSWFVDKYSKFKATDIPVELSKSLEIMEPPNDCYKMIVTVRYSDLDSNLHTNQSVYIKFCFDCATMASERGQLRHFTGDISWFPVIYMSVDYLGESFVGDEILVVLWQDFNDISTLFFSIYNATDKRKLSNVVCKLGLKSLKTSPRL